MERHRPVFECADRQIQPWLRGKLRRQLKSLRSSGDERLAVDAGEALPTNARWDARKVLFSEDQPNGFDFEGSAGDIRRTQEDVRNV